MSDPFEEIVDSCMRLCAQTRFVRLEEAGLAALAREIAPRVTPQDFRHTPHHLIGRGADTIAYFLLLDAINFGSGYFSHLARAPGESGYFTVALRLRDWFVSDGTPFASVLRRVNAGEMACIFQQDRDDPVIMELMELFARAFHEVADYADALLGGRLDRVLEVNGFAAAAIVRSLARMDMFADVSDSPVGRVSLYKRAQIFVHDIALAAKEGDMPAVTGADRLTAFADDLLPYVLRAKGALSYAPALEARILRKDPLTQGEPAEVALRAASIVAVERLRVALLALGVSAQARDVDYVLWNMGHGLGPTPGAARHVCRSVFY